MKPVPPGESSGKRPLVRVLWIFLSASTVVLLAGVLALGGWGLSGPSAQLRMINLLLARQYASRAWWSAANVFQTMGESGHWESLKYAVQDRPPVYQRLQDIGELNFWTDLTPEEVESLRALPELERLTLTTANPQFTVLKSLPKLKHLSVDLGSTDFPDLSAIGALTQLESLTVSGRGQFDLRPLSSLGRLKELRLGGPGVKTLRPLASLSSLTKLEIYFADDLLSLEAVRCFSRLEQLSLIHCPKVSTLDCLADLPELKSLRVYRCEAIADLTGLAFAPRLERLDLSHLPKILDVENVGAAQELRSLTLQGVPAADLSSLGQLRHLQKLRISNCKRVSTFDPLKGLGALRDVRIHHAGQLWERHNLASAP